MVSPRHSASLAPAGTERLVQIEPIYRAAMQVISMLSNFGLVSIVVVLLASVLVRYLDILQGSLDWGAEYCRFAISWVIMLGSAVALDRGAHVGIDLTGMVPARLRRAMRSVASGLAFAFVGVLAWQGFLLSAETMDQISPALGLPMGYAYLAVPVGAAIMAVQSVLFAIRPELMVRWMPGAEDMAGPS